MFITTNRVGTIDLAFKSRIHLSITYPSFSEESRLKLWKTFLFSGTISTQQQWLSEEFLRKISKESINGRQIKNIVRMAHSRAVNAGREIVSEDTLLGLDALKSFEVDFQQAVEKVQLQCEESTRPPNRQKLRHRP